MEFRNNVLIIGYGSVSQCTLPILLKHIQIPFENITIMDFEDKRQALKPWTDKGIQFTREKLRRKPWAKPCRNISPRAAC